MHVQLLVPRLLDPVLRHVLTPADPSASLAALELLFARGRRNPCLHSLEGWLQQVYGLAPTPDEVAGAGLAALGMLGDGLAPGTDLCVHADPVHLRVNPDGMVLTDSSLFGVAPDEAHAIAAHLNAHFTGRLQLELSSPERWYARVSGMPPLHCATLDEVRGGALGAHLPHGPGGRAWQALLNEVQMALHEHPVNEAREARGEAVINSLWFWGAGTLDSPVSRPYAMVSADSPLARGLALASGARGCARPADAATWLQQAPAAGVALIVIDALRAPVAYADAEACLDALRALERDWLAPLLQALREGRIGMLSLHACGTAGGQSVECVRGDLRRFWRRPKPFATWLAGEKPESGSKGNQGNNRSKSLWHR